MTRRFVIEMLSYYLKFLRRDIIALRAHQCIELRQRYRFIVIYSSCNTITKCLITRGSQIASQLQNSGWNTKQSQ